MARFIEIQDAAGLLSPLKLKRGDVLQFSATGGKVKHGTSVELSGAFVTAVVGDSGEVYAPVGPPNCVLFVAREPGHSLVNVFVGDPFQISKAVEISIEVEP